MLSLDKNLSFINNQFRNTSFSKHFHNDYCFSLIYQGNLLFDNEKEKYNFTQGVLQVVNPYEFHTNKNSDWSSLNLMPTIDFINSIANDMTQNDIKRDITFNTFTIDKQAISLFNCLFLLMKNKEPNKMILDQAVINFFEYMIKYHVLDSVEKIANITCSKKDINKALEYINNYSEWNSLTLEDISKEIGISKYHFIKEFKRHLGITPNQYIQIRKVNHSKELIKKGVSFSQVAYECGFTDQSYMIKVFKKYHGYTPSKLK